VGHDLLEREGSVRPAGRWIVEVCLAWLFDNRRIVRRYERNADHFHAFADLACLLLSYRRWTKVTN
jgi:hypothetical protein